MTIRETAIAKIQQLPESLVQEISDFIDFVTRNHQAKTANPSLEGDRCFEEKTRSLTGMLPRPNAK